MTVWVVMTDSPSYGGDVSGVFATEAEALSFINDLAKDSQPYAVEWTVGKRWGNLRSICEKGEGQPWQYH